MKPVASLFLVVTACVALGACGPVGLAVGAGATAGAAAVQERGAAQAARDTGTQVAIGEKLFQKDIDLFGKVSSIVVEGRALLTGVVPTQADKDEAARQAWTVESVRDVINEIQVAASGGIADFGRDTRITTELRGKLLGDGQIMDINYNIETVNGTIYLMGIAQNPDEVRRIVDYARAISGVRQVVSHVMMKDDPRRMRG